MCSCEAEKMLSERETLLVRDYDAALDFARLNNRHTIFDVATGSGRMLSQLVKRGFAVVSGDIDPRALDRARERLSDLAHKPTLVILDAHKLQFDDGSFHAITFVNAIHEIRNPRGALDEIARVLTDDGKLLVVEFNSRGFELMELHHRMQGKGEHPKGELSTEEVDLHLRSLFGRVEVREFSITHAWVASGKRRRNSR